MHQNHAFGGLQRFPRHLRPMWIKGDAKREGRGGRKGKDPQCLKCVDAPEESWSTCIE